ncbi:hypothetical protein D3C86_1623060 [compost metagenome]
MNSSVRSRRSAPCVAASALASRALARLPATSPTVGLNCPTAIRRWFWISCLSLMAFQYRARARSATRQLHGGAVTHRARAFTLRLSPHRPGCAKFMSRSSRLCDSYMTLLRHPIHLPGSAVPPEIPEYGFETFGAKNNGFRKGWFCLFACRD